MRENDFATPFHPEEVRTARVCNMRSVSGRRKKVVRDEDAKETSCNNGGEGWETSVDHGGKQNVPIVGVYTSKGTSGIVVDENRKAKARVVGDH